MSKKMPPKKVVREKKSDELEQLFSQFEEQLQLCEEKIGTLNQMLSEFTAQKTQADDPEESSPEPSPPHAP